MAKISNTSGASNIWLGSKSNSRQSILYVPAALTANKPGLLFLESINDGATASDLGGVYLWADDANAFHVSATYPTDQDDASTIIAAASTDATLLSIAALGTAADKMLYTTGVDTWAELAVTSYGRSILDDTSEAVFKATVNLEIGTDVLAYDAGLSNLAGIAMVADRMYYTSANDTHVATPITATGRSILDDASTAAVLTTIGAAASGSNADITVLSGLTGDISDPVNIAMTGTISGGTTISVSSDISTSAGDIEIASDTGMLRMGATVASDSYIYFNGTNMVFYDLANDTAYPSGMTLNQLVAGTTLNPVVNGNLTITQGDFDWTNDTTATESATWTLGAAAVDGIDIVSSNTSANVLHITADATTSGTLLYLKAVDATITTGEFILCHDGGDQAFAVKRYGEVEIAGSATGIPIFTMDAGDMVLSDGSLTITDADNATTLSVINNTITTTGNLLSLASSSLTSATSLLITTDAGAAGMFIDCVNTGSKFSVDNDYGQIIVAGNASTDVLTLTAGDFQITAGDIDLDNGFISIITQADQTSEFKRNVTSLTTPVLEIEQTHASGGVALLVDQDATGNLDAMDITYEGTGKALHFTLGNIAGYGLYFDVAANHTDPIFKADMGTWEGTAAEGLIDIVTDASDQAEEGQIIRILKQGHTTATSAAVSGEALYIQSDNATKSGTYLVHLESTLNDAMYIAKGAVKFADAEQCQFGTSEELKISNDGTNSYLTITDPLRIGAATTNYMEFSAAGVPTFAGTGRPTRTYWIPSTVFAVGSQGTAVEALTGAGADKAHSWAFADGAKEDIVTSFRVPDGFDHADDVTFEIYWCANVGANAVKWDVVLDHLVEDADIDADNEITDTVTDTVVSATVWDLNITAATTIASADWSADEFVTVYVARDGAAGGDTLVGDANFLGILLTARTTTV